MRSLTSLSLAIGLATLAGCSTSGHEDKEPEYTGVEFEYGNFTPDKREENVSWGHQGRGGAALRKPAYQYVLSTDDKLYTRYGKLHPELQPQAAPTLGMPAGMLTSNCNEPSAQTFPAPQHISYAPSTGGVALVRAEATAPVDEYLKVRKKLCAGSNRLTYEEWLILVNGTPKDIPLHLQPKANTPR